MIFKSMSEGEEILYELIHSQISWEGIKRRELAEEAVFEPEMMIKSIEQKHNFLNLRRPPHPTSHIFSWWIQI